MGTQRSGQQQDADAAPGADPPGDALMGSAMACMATNVATFAGDLDKAAQLFRDIQAIDGGRIGCMMALKAVIDFCDNAGLGTERRLPLIQLFFALKSAENGAVDPLLKIAPRPNAPPLTEAERRQRGFLAAAMEALIRGGLKRNDAARWVANKSRNLIAATRVRTELWKAVKSWRVTAMGGDITRDLDASAFRVACGEFGKGSAIGPQAAEAMLKMAAAEGVIQETPPLS